MYQWTITYQLNNDRAEKWVASGDDITLKRSSKKRLLSALETYMHSKINPKEYSITYDTVEKVIK